MNVEEFKSLLNGTNENKYKAKKKMCSHGHMHDSTKEARRCDELHLLKSTGVIQNLEFQKSYLVIPAIYEERILDEVYKRGERKGQRKVKRYCSEQASYYKADFVYYDNSLKKNVIEDCKGKRTKDYILKRKLMKHQYCNEDTIFIET